MFKIVLIIAINDSKLNYIQNPSESYYKELFLKVQSQNDAYESKIFSLEKENESLKQSLREMEILFVSKNKTESKLLDENEKLRLFRENVYLFSQKYDEFNENILDLIKTIDTIVQNIVSTTSDEYEGFLSRENRLLNKKTIEILNEMSKFYNFKQEEYNYLLRQKDKIIESLKYEVDALKRKNSTSFQKYINNKLNYKTSNKICSCFSGDKTFTESNKYPKTNKLILNNRNKLDKLYKSSNRNNSFRTEDRSFGQTIKSTLINNYKSNKLRYLKKKILDLLND